MEHSFIDKYSKLDSPIHKLDPKTKIISAIIYIVCVVLTPPQAIAEFILFFIFILAMLLISKVPLRFVMKRSLVIFPFILLVVVFIPFLKKGELAGFLNVGTIHLAVSYGGLWMVWNVIVKSFLSVLAMILLGSTTNFQILLKGLEQLHLPKVFLMTLAFMYRYLFIIVDEAMRMERAHKSRYFGGQALRQIRIFSNIIGLLFIRAYERGERAYQSMCARGFDREIKTFSRVKFTLRDGAYLCLFLAVMAGVKILGVYL